MKKRAGRPRVIANFAITADGKVSTRNFTPTGFTSKADKRRLQEIRCLGDALLAGARTVSVDQMSMGVSASDLRDRRRAAGLPPEPLRIIVSNKGHIDPCWKVFQRPGAPIVIFSTRRMRQTSRASIALLADLWIFNSPKVDLAAMLRNTANRLRGTHPRLRGWPKPFSSAVGNWSDRRTSSHMGACDIRRGGIRLRSREFPASFLPKTIRCRLKKMQVEGRECFLTYAL